jgi:hypothetical protein
MFIPPIDPFNAGLFLPVRKQFSKKGSAQLQARRIDLGQEAVNVIASTVSLNLYTQSGAWFSLFCYIEG